MLRFSIRYVSTETSDDFVDCRTEAANCFCILANMYNVNAMMRFAQMLIKGDGIDKNQKEAEINLNKIKDYSNSANNDGKK